MQEREKRGKTPVTYISDERAVILDDIDFSSGCADELVISIEYIPVEVGEILVTDAHIVEITNDINE